MGDFFLKGTTFPALCTLLAQWAPPEEKGKLSTFVFAGNIIFNGKFTSSNTIAIN